MLLTSGKATKISKSLLGCAKDDNGRYMASRPIWGKDDEQMPLRGWIMITEVYNAPYKVQETEGRAVVVVGVDVGVTALFGCLGVSTAEPRFLFSRPSHPRKSKVTCPGPASCKREIRLGRISRLVYEFVDP